MSFPSDHEPEGADPAQHAHKGRPLLMAGMMAAQASALIRYVILARLLGPTQLGLGSTLILSAALFDLITDTGGDRFLLSDAEGGTTRAKGLVQFVFVIRGALIAAMMIACAPLLARFFNSSELTIPFMILAVSPLVLGFENLDFRAAQREGNFSAEGFIRISCEVANLIVTITVALISHSYVAVLAGAIARSTMWVIATHVWSSRKYRLVFDPEIGKRMLAFSAPLLLSGVAVYLGQQGDRVLIGRKFGITNLGVYSAVLLLINMPASAMVNYVQTIFLPRIAALQRQVEPRAGQINLSGVTAVIAVSMAAGFLIVAPPFVHLFYGKAFTVDRATIALIGILQSARFLTVWPTTTAAAFGRSGQILLTNFVRMIGWPLSLAVAGPLGLKGVISAFIACELLATVVALFFLSRRAQGLIEYRRHLVLFVLGSILVWIWSLLISHTPNWAAISVAGVVTIVFLAWNIRKEMNSIGDVIELFLHRRLI
jgi:lipopolysaccharide exporter